MKPSTDSRNRDAFVKALRTLKAANVPFVVAGAYALNHYTGIWRNTKDLDLFCEPTHAQAALDALAAAGFETRVEEAHWIGKAFLGDSMVDIIWGGGNWATFVDRHWIEEAERGTCLDEEVLFAPAEDMILSKAYVAGRERFDGADISHLIRARGDRFDWDALVERFGPHWELLLQYLVLYRFVYPAERDKVPAELIHRLAKKVGTPEEVADGLHFRGCLVDRYAYLHDLEHEGRPDPGEVLADRAGMPLAAVKRRRRLDKEALDAGLIYKALPEKPAKTQAARKEASLAEVVSDAPAVRSSSG